VPKNIPYPLLVAATLLLTSCATNQEKWLVPRRVIVLRHKRDWPRIESVARREIERQKGDAEFARNAFYRPIEHTNGVWFVTVSGVMFYQDHYGASIKGANMRGGYPRSGFWDAFDLEITDGGQVLSYVKRSESQYDTGWTFP
jgi:hypothetical protein